MTSPPAAADLADDLVPADHRAVQPDLGDFGPAVDARDGSGRHPRGGEVEPEHRQAPVAAVRRTRPGQQRAPGRDVTVRAPRLLAGDLELIVVRHRPGPQRREVAARVGFGEPLAPDLVPGDGGGQVLGGESGREPDEHRPDDVGVAEHLGHDISGGRQLVDHDRPRQPRSPKPAVRHRPAQTRPARVEQQSLERPLFGELLLQGHRPLPAEGLQVCAALMKPPVEPVPYARQGRLGVSGDHTRHRHNSPNWRRESRRLPPGRRRTDKASADRAEVNRSGHVHVKLRHLYI
nr:hypothetical protein [Frankia sp. Cr1]